MESTMTPVEELPVEEKSVAESRTEALRAKQIVCPANAPTYSPDWFREGERYLLAKGWEKDTAGAMTYRDPKGSHLKGGKQYVRDLPVKGDDLRKSEPLYQYHVPPSTYSFTLVEALDMQRRRDDAGGDGVTLQERLTSCEQRCNELEMQADQFKSRIRALLNTPQLSYEGMKLGLRELIGG